MSNSGGTLTLPSPTHPHHHVDVPAGIRSLRRSISRSPSKFPVMRTASQSSSDAGSSPSTPTIRRVQSQYFGQNASFHSPCGNQPHTQSPLATPFRPSVKLSLRSAKSTKSPASGSPSGRPFSRHRTSPKSPSRRALSQASSTSGNSIPSTTPPPSSSLESPPSGQENINIFRTRSPAHRKAANRHSMHLDVTGSSQSGNSRAPDANNANHSKTPSTSVVSPLKRSDAIMNLDQTFSGSPQAKRRSYGPSNIVTDFNNIFDAPAPPPNLEFQNDTDYEWTPMDSTNITESAISTTPSSTRRTGSLRRSTIQQRERSWGKRSGSQHLAQGSHDIATPQRERLSWGKRQAAMQLTQGSNETVTPNGKNRGRLSMDHFMPPPARESPFTMPGPLPNPSAHIFNQQTHQPHPLSNAMTTSSSSGSSFAGASPVQFHAPITEKSRAPMNFSKSLPIGAVRPQPERTDQAIGSVSTPDYKNARPYEGAFASTGLISKMNRHPEIAPLGGGYGAVPDTPCKKQPSGYATYPPLPMSGNAKTRGRHIRHTFGQPSTPGGATPSCPNIFTDKPRSIHFGSGFSNHSRTGSLLSLHSDDGRSPLQPNEYTESGFDGDLPPTPTKQTMVPRSSNKLGLSNESPTTNRRLPAPMSAVGMGTIFQQDTAASSKYSSLKQSHSDGYPGRHDVASVRDAPESPMFGLCRFPISPAISPSLNRSRGQRTLLSTPVPFKSNSNVPFVESTRNHDAKKSSVTAASPLERLDFAETASPRTPQASIMPPDASRLSISNAADNRLFPGTGDRNSLFQPATPTTRQEKPSTFLERRAITPINGMPSHDLDERLMIRFGKVEFIGKGEFSEVYKVTNLPQPARITQNGFFTTPTHRTPSHSSAKVYAVKKLTLPIGGKKDRALRLREVCVLNSLRGRDHILQIIDNWEENSCLYIQTEYCEEGSLDKFLSVIGLRGRLDDFRIWKILLEIGTVCTKLMNDVCHTN